MRPGFRRVNSVWIASGVESVETRRPGLGAWAAEVSLPVGLLGASFFLTVWAHVDLAEVDDPGVVGEAIHDRVRRGLLDSGVAGRADGLRFCAAAVARGDHLFGRPAHRS